jgi:hypothetical protein
MEVRKFLVEVCWVAPLVGKGPVRRGGRSAEGVRSGVCASWRPENQQNLTDCVFDASLVPETYLDRCVDFERTYQ